MIEDVLSFLVIDDDAGDRKQLNRLIKKQFADSHVANGEAVSKAIDAYQDDAFNVVFLDYRMPDLDGLSGIGIVRRTWSDAAVIMVTGQGDEKAAAEAIKLGAMDYIPKDEVSLNSLRFYVKSALDKRALEHKVEAHTKDLETFTYAMSHDLRSPLVSLKMLCDMAIEDLPELSVEAIQEQIATMSGLTDRMLGLVRSVTDHISLHSSAKFENFPLERAVENAIDNLRAEISTRNAEVTVAGLPKVYGCEVQMTQLFQNLIGNGIKFSTQPTPVIRVFCDSTGGRSEHICIADNGIGIDAAYSDKIFEPFRRLHHESEFQGNGLGLATCKRIVEIHNGELWFRPGQEGGSEFHLSIPAAVNL